MSSKGVGHITLVNGLMDSVQYCEILKNGLRQSAIDLGMGRRFVFQQDNDPKVISFINTWICIVKYLGFLEIFNLEYHNSLDKTNHFWLIDFSTSQNTQKSGSKRTILIPWILIQLSVPVQPACPEFF